MITSDTDLFAVNVSKDYPWNNAAYVPSGSAAAKKETVLRVIGQQKGIGATSLFDQEYTDAKYLEPGVNYSYSFRIVPVNKGYDADAICKTVLNSGTKMSVSESINFANNTFALTNAASTSTYLSVLADGSVNIQAALGSTSQYWIKEKAGDMDVADAFRINLTQDGIHKIVTAIGDEAYANYMIRTYFTARINSNAEMAQEIPNQATAEYVTGTDLKYSAKSDIPVVYTGGANLLKVDAVNQEKTLAGATFKIFRNATEEEVANNVAGLTNIEGVVPPVVPVSFYNNPELTGEKITEAVSGEDGKIAIYGLAYGTYYLVEKVAPEGYNLMKDLLELTVDATSHLEENTVKVENVNGSTLPGTGGMGTALFTAFGVMLIGVAVVLLVVRKRMAVYEN